MSIEQVSNFPHDCLINEQEVVLPWQRFERHFINDLAWLIFSPSLISSDLDKEAMDYELWGLPAREQDILQVLEGMDKLNPSDSQYKPETGKLGKYFETLLDFGLQLLPWAVFATAARNVQLIENGRTLGEVDFLLSATNKHYLHLEAAVKFYLRPKLSKGENFNNWHGPNAKDRLDKKVSHLRNKQLALLKKVNAQSDAIQHSALSFLTPKDFTHMEARFYLKGMLFIHWEEPASLPATLNPNLLLGHWLYYSEFVDLVSRTLAEQVFIPLNKNQWLSGTTEHECVEKIPLSRSKHHYPMMYKRRVFTGVKKINESRLMVVPDYWPANSSPSRIM
ncbi:hypothetical protein SAMN02745866_02598 [Alteromonadaceae bacterium Bs31]|nr:hypothetical protein SAMN02745866_02598 [Alteromonadaceae bacterium Bs31]